MLRGIDVSNHQGDNGIVLEDVLPYYDFCLCKATGGDFFVDSYCDGFIRKCVKAGKPWGFYHFANDGEYSDAETEARFFYDNCRNYFGSGIPVLDWEVDEVDADWVNEFVNCIHDWSGVWCWVYGNAWRFSDDVEPNCARWVAAYPSWILYPNPDFDPGEPPEVDGLLACWQYASDGRCDGYWGNLDVNMYYGDVDSWQAYCKGDGWTEPNVPDGEPHVMEDSEYRITIERKHGKM